MAGAAGRRSIGDEVDRIGDAGVLGLGAVVEIQHAGLGVDHHILQHRAEALGGGEDFRLGFARQLDRLGVAAALEIEDAFLRPAMLVIADQGARGIGRQGGLAGARQAEEDRRVIVVADIGRAMHRHHALGRQQVVEIGEDRLLHLAGIGGAADQHDLLGEIHRDHGLAAAAVALGIGAEAGQVDDGEFGEVAQDVFLRRADQQVAE